MYSKIWSLNKYNYKLLLNNAAVNCKAHYMTPGNGASWMGHLPQIPDAGVPSLKPLVRHDIDEGVRQCQSFYLGSANTNSGCV